jgi:RNA polymerase sigma-70 factor (ECF subfamily)
MRGGDDRRSFAGRRRLRRWPVRGNPPVTDWSGCIVAIAQARDKQQFALLFSYFAPRLKGFFARLGVSAGIAEDLAQDVMLTVWNKADRFDPALASASTWIFTIARNLRVDAARRERDVRWLPGDDDVAGEPRPDDQLMSAERESRLREALKSLPADQARVIRLSFFEDRAQSEIAAVLNIPLGTVKSRVRLAMNRLRALVEDLQ